MHIRLSLAFALLPLTLAPLHPTQAQTAAPQVAAPQAITKPTLTVLHTAGISSNQPLILGADGALYGVTDVGGADSSGTVFKVTRGGLFHTLAKLHPQNGSNLSGPLLLMPDGALMGTASLGGKSGYGSLFLLTPPHRFQIKHEFSMIANSGHNVHGATPSGALALGPDGAVYGTTLTGGAVGKGVVYRWTEAHGVEVLHDFLGGDADGDNPQGLTLGPDGALYGVTFYGGTHNCGTIFRVTTEGLFTLLHSFDIKDGFDPQIPPVSGKDGALYGVSFYGGVDAGTAYRITPRGDFTLLHNFLGQTEGGSPDSLTLAPDGSFYGTTNGGGPGSGYGTIFHMSSDGHVTVLHTFQDLDAGRFAASVVLGPDNVLYGNTEAGGLYDQGTVFKLRLP